MFLSLNHKKFDVYLVASELLIECYCLTTNIPDIERYGLISQIRRAALSVKLNIAEGASRKSAVERKRFYEIARGSVIELDAAFEACVHLKYVGIEKLTTVESQIKRCFSMLSKMV